MGQKTHAIIGTGETSPKALAESLGEAIDEGDAVAIVWAGPPNSTVEAVYDYILDNEMEFTMFYSDDHTPPKVFRTADNGVTQKSRNPIVAAAKAVADGGKVLLLWSDDEQDDYVNAADAIDGAVLFLELSNGLAPISFAEEDTSDSDDVVGQLIAEEEEAQEEDEAFTREELLNMPAAAVKRYGVKAGAKAATKGGIIDELFPEDEEEEEHDADVGHAPPPAVKEAPSFPRHSNEEDQWVKLERSLTNITPDAAVIENIEELREAFKSTGAALLALSPFSRERSLAITKLEEAVMWAIKGLVLSSEVK